MLNSIDLSRVDLNLLVLFATVYQEKHVGRAARRLHISPSAVSHGIRRLRSTFNDPLFLKHPKGIVPTQRATELAQPVEQILAQVRVVMSSTEPFDAKHSNRRFVIGAPDAIAAVSLPAAITHVARESPNLTIGVRDVLPAHALAALDAREIDVALYPLDEVPARFESRTIYEEHFAIAARRGHALGRKPSLKDYCEARHIVVSHAADPRGFIDEILAKQGKSRIVSLTVPSFMWALVVIGESDLIGTMPRALINAHGHRFGVVAIEAPVAIPKFQVRAVAPKVAFNDPGIVWLVDMLARFAQPRAPKARRRSR